ncbi:MAG: hypothetical protein IT379_16700 [Deltaproteobacteria bacterium]|nr:hypothetical protein [Deltaproteobacteria bacterium]
MTRLLAIAVLLLSAACETGRIKLEDLTHATECRTRAVAGEPTYVVSESSLPTTIAGLVPYVRISGVGTKSAEALVQQVCTRLDEMNNPDVIVYADRGSVATGGVGSYIGFGVSTYQTTYSNVIAATAFRLAPTRLGFGLDDSGMVISVDDRIRSSGLLEGDTVTSVAGQPLERGERWFSSPHYSVLLRGQPDQAVELVWIRPGTGRMSGTSHLLASDRESLRTLPLAPKLKQYKPLDHD